MSFFDDPPGVVGLEGIGMPPKPGKATAFESCGMYLMSMSPGFDAFHGGIAFPFVGRTPYAFGGLVVVIGGVRGIRGEENVDVDELRSSEAVTDVRWVSSGVWAASCIGEEARWSAIRGTRNVLR